MIKQAEATQVTGCKGTRLCAVPTKGAKPESKDAKPESSEQTPNKPKLRYLLSHAGLFAFKMSKSKSQEFYKGRYWD